MTSSIKHKAVERIWLVPDASEGELGYAWCDDPAPGAGMDPEDAIEYVRKDSHDSRVAELEQERDALAVSIKNKFEYCPSCFHVDQREYVNGHCSICGEETQMGDKDLYIELIKKQNLELKRGAEKLKTHLENCLGILGIELPSEKPSLKLVHVNKDEK